MLTIRRWVELKAMAPMAWLLHRGVLNLLRPGSSRNQRYGACRNWIVLRGNDDGIGIAGSTKNIELGQQVVGRVWESCFKEDV